MWLVHFLPDAENEWNLAGFIKNENGLKIGEGNWIIVKGQFLTIFYFISFSTAMIKGSFENGLHGNYFRVLSSW